MPPAHHIASEERLCPACLYDLRATTSGRCPECGTIVGTGPVSRLPWVHRTLRGGRQAYLATLWLLLLRPRYLADETRRPLARRHARRFAQESISLAAILATGALTVAVLARGPRLDRWFMPTLVWIGGERSRGIPVGPVFILLDGLWSVLPLFLTTLVALHLSAWHFRRTLAIAARRRYPDSPWKARRAWILGDYLAGTLPLLALFFGGTLACAVAQLDLVLEAAFLWRVLVLVGLIVLPLLGLWTCYVPVCALLRNAAGVTRGRAFWLATLLIPSQLLIWFAAGNFLFWLCGYLAIAFWSMFH